VRFTCVRADINLKEVTINSATGDYNPTSLAHVINTETLNSLVVQTWLDKSGASASRLVSNRDLLFSRHRQSQIHLGILCQPFPRQGAHTNVP
jgi:hypothetical protein